MPLFQICIIYIRFISQINVRLASVQEQRVPPEVPSRGSHHPQTRHSFGSAPFPGGYFEGLTNGCPELSPSPPLEHTSLTPQSAKVGLLTIIYLFRINKYLFIQNFIYFFFKITFDRNYLLNKYHLFLRKDFLSYSFNKLYLCLFGYIYI